MDTGTGSCTDALDLDERFFLGIALKNGLLEPEAAEEAARLRRELAASGRPKAIWAILLDRGLLAAPEVDRIHAAQAATHIRRIDGLYAAIALELGLAPRDEVERALAAARQGGHRTRLGATLLDRGALLPSQHRRILSELRRRMATEEAAYVATLVERPRLEQAPSGERLRLDATVAGGAAPGSDAPDPMVPGLPSGAFSISSAGSMVGPLPSPDMAARRERRSSEELEIPESGESRDLARDLDAVRSRESSDAGLLASAERTLAELERSGAGPALRRRELSSLDEDARRWPASRTSAVRAALWGAALTLGVAAAVTSGAREPEPAAVSARRSAPGVASHPMQHWTSDLTKGEVGVKPPAAGAALAPGAPADPRPVGSASEASAPGAAPAPTAAPASPQRPFLLAQEHERAGRLDLALPAYRTARDAAPEGSGFRALLDARIASAERALREAEAAADRLWPDAIAALRDGRAPAAALLLSRLASVRPEPRTLAARDFARALGDAVYVPPGPFPLGSDDPDLPLASPRHVSETAAFFIDRTEIRNRDYLELVRATGARPPSGWAAEGDPFPPEEADWPVAGVTWDEARGYAAWRGRRLPTEEEWEKAAGGTDGRPYPWGHDPQGASANTMEATGSEPPSARAAGRSPGDVSPYGAYDMGGNVAEWTSSLFLPYPGSAAAAVEFSESLRVVRGGSWRAPRERSRSAARDRASPFVPYPEIGFRCVADVPDCLAELRAP